MSKTSKTTKSIKGTRTEQNVVNAFMAESQAYTRYMFYASAADKENYFPVGIAFRQSAENEKRHAKVFLKMLENNEVKCTGMVDAGFLKDRTTVENLECAIKEESVDGYIFYTEAAKVAREEGFDEIATHFEAIATVEKFHHDRFVTYKEQIEAGTVWKRDHVIKWQCLVCGYIHEGKTPPKVCPGCDHPYQHYYAMDMAQDVES